MNCDAVGPLLADRLRGRLDQATSAAVDAHTATCERCRQQQALEEALDGALDRLPRLRAPAGLRRQLAQLIDASPLAAPRRRAPFAATVGASLLGGCLAAALVLAVVRLDRSLGEPSASPSSASSPSSSSSSASATLAMADEAVNDHLRVVSSTHPAEIESGGIHQVKPWFTGRLEFAPRVTFAGDEEFPLLGGSVGYFGDRKAAVFLFRHRLHAITLLVFPPAGLSWPPATPLPGARIAVAETSTRGFNVVLWRDAGLGYALVSDVNPADLLALAARINPE